MSQFIDMLLKFTSEVFNSQQFIPDEAARASGKAVLLELSKNGIGCKVQ